MVDKLFRVAVLGLVVVALILGVQIIVNNAEARVSRAHACSAP